MKAGIIDQIGVERRRQDSLHPYKVPDWMLTVLVEEVGEVARAMIEEKPQDLIGRFSNVPPFVSNG